MRSLYNGAVLSPLLENSMLFKRHYGKTENMKEDTLRRYRLMLRMTQEQLAGKLGVDRMTVLRYENGETRIRYAVGCVVKMLLAKEGINPMLIIFSQLFYRFQISTFPFFRRHK
jgi:DNA-binding XRE family transcriptional regulator